MASLKDLIRYNSEGRLIHPTEEGIENFRKWFGESKMFDAEGNPLVVYHGSKVNFNAEPINTFDLSKAGTKTDEGWMGKGFYFGNKDTANAYAGHQEFDPDHFPIEGVVYPSYLSLKNPAILIDAKRNPSILARELVNLPAESTAQEVRDALIDAGYDGVIYKKNHGDSYSEYAAFYPEQIKSATGNTGAFSPTDPSILRSHPIATALAGTGLAGMFASGQQPAYLPEEIDKFLDKRYDPAGLEAMTGVAPPTRYGDILQTVAGLSDIYAPLAAAEAVDYARENDWKNAGLSALGAVPMFGGAVGRIKPKRGLAGMK